MTSGLLCLALGVTECAAWVVHATAVLRFGGGPYPMPFNSALTLAVTGAALALHAARRWLWATILVAAVFDTVLGLLSLAEDVFGHSLGIDQLLVRAYISGPGGHPGRMPGSTAACYVLIGLGLLAWAPWRSRPRPVVIAATGALTSAIAIAAAFRYEDSALHAYDWGRLSSMAVPTAAALIVLGISLPCAAWRGASYERLSLIHI